MYLLKSTGRIQLKQLENFTLSRGKYLDKLKYGRNLPYKVA